MSNLVFLQAVERLGEIELYQGLQLVAHGPPQTFIGEVCDILDAHNQPLTQAEVIGFKDAKVFLMPFASQPIKLGAKVRACGYSIKIPVGEKLLGRIVDGYMRPLDNLGALACFSEITIQAKQINPLDREPIQERLETGITAIDAFLTLGRGQRVGLFSGSGVGKSVLLGQITKNSQADVNVIALIGERGREVNDFIQNYFNAESLKKSVVVVACSNEPPLMRKQALFAATTIAEYFCQQGKEVLLLADSITRFAMAQREIGLSLGEPPTHRGYPPSVFSLLPELVERAGNFKNQGSITALYTVLVEGDDFNEPISDQMRSLLDGHIILTRELAQRGHFPAIDLLQSCSRLNKQILSSQELELIQQILALLRLHHEHKDFIAVGAYKPGINPALDRAIAGITAVNALLIQKEDKNISMKSALEQLSEILR